MVLKMDIQTEITSLRNKKMHVPKEERSYFINSLNLAQDQLDHNFKILAESTLNKINEILNEIFQLEKK